MTKRSKGWAVIRNEAPTMPWEVGHPSILTDAFKRVAGVAGASVILRFWNDCVEMESRLQDLEGVDYPAPANEDSVALVRQFYFELRELHGHEYAQRFMSLWDMLGGFMERAEKGLVARAAVRKQIRRIARR
jgi:hypothetical protein